MLLAAIMLQPVKTVYSVAVLNLEMQASRIGVVRDSMLANPLLIRPALGKTKSKGLTCLGPDFVYGTVATIQDGGVSEALSNWHTHSLPTSGSRGHSRRPEKDFVALNREGVKSGLVTAKEHYQYRATHDRRQATLARRGSHVPVPPRIPPDTTFGISTHQPPDRSDQELSARPGDVDRGDGERFPGPKGSPVFWTRAGDAGLLQTTGDTDRCIRNRGGCPSYNSYKKIRCSPWKC
ncbi:cilia- and flagella-associated protein 77 isoform 5-T5 [Salvelinus alpinus]